MAGASCAVGGGPTAAVFVQVAEKPLENIGWDPRVSLFQRSAQLVLVDRAACTTGRAPRHDSAARPQPCRWLAAAVGWRSAARRGAPPSRSISWNSALQPVATDSFCSNRQASSAGAPAVSCSSPPLCTLDIPGLGLGIRWYGCGAGRAMCGSSSRRSVHHQGGIAAVSHWHACAQQ